MIYPQYIRPKSIDELWKQLPAGKKVYYLAGGTDLLNCLRDGVIDAEKSVFADISMLKEINGISEQGDFIRIGSAATFASILRNNLVLEWAPSLASAAKTMGTPQIANRATIGGNVAFASPAGDSIPALAVHSAKVEIASAHSARVMEVIGIFTGPQKTNLENGDIITAILIPKAAPRSGFEVKGAFKKFGGRKAHIISKASVAVAAYASRESLENIRVAVGSLGPTVIFIKNLPQSILLKDISKELLDKWISEIQKAVSPIDDFRSTADYRRHIVGPLFKQVLSEITGNTQA